MNLVRYRRVARSHAVGQHGAMEPHLSPSPAAGWCARLARTALVALTSAPALAQVTVDSTLNVVIGFGDPGAAGEQIVANFDASGSDKLVVVVSSEHAFGINSGLTLDGLEYNGQAMVEAVEESTLPGTTALYYLDDPGPAGEIRLFVGMKNGGLATVYALSNVAPGIAATGQSTTTSVGLTTMSADSIVIAGILDGGQASNGNGAVAPTATAPQTQVHSDIWGINMWGGHASGYEIVGAAGPHTATFGTAGPVRLRTVAGAFDAVPPLGTNYCTTLANSTGAPGVMSADGSSSVAANDLVLVATSVPNQPGLFYYGPTQVLQPFGNGFRCVGGTVGRLDVHNAVANTITHALDVTAPPNAATTITGGTTWNFQCWYRDPAAGGASFNLSDGLEVQFAP